MNHIAIETLSLFNRGLKRVLTIVDRFLSFVIATGVAIIMVAIIFHVIGRYFFGATYMGTMELIRYIMIWVSLLGAVLAFGCNEHVKVTIFENILSRRNYLFMNLAADTLLLVFLGAMVAGGIEISMRNMQQTSLGLQIPMGYPYLAIPMGAGFMILYVFSGMVEKSLTLSHLEK